MKITSKRDELIAEAQGERKSAKPQKEHSDLKQLRRERKFMDLREFLMSLQEPKKDK
jgi:hypothetical protein